jgi:hypothetical protein
MRILVKRNGVIILVECPEICREEDQAEALTRWIRDNGIQG